jgi:hypothetical protein
MATAREIKNSFKLTLKRLRIIFFALTAGMLILAILAFSLQQRPLVSTPDGNSPYVYLVPLLALAGYFAGLYIFNWLLTPLTPERELGIRLARYQSACLLRYSCLEVPALLALFAYIAEGYVFYAAIATFLIIYLFTLRPTYVKMLRQMPLSRDEENILGTTGSKL